MGEKRSRWANWIIIAAIFVGVTAVRFLNPSDTVMVGVKDDHLVLEGCKNVQYFIPMSTIERMTYEEDPMYAADTKGVVCGTYTSDDWGEHVLYVDTGIDACIVVESTNGTYVFNVESEDTTKAFYEAFLEIL